MPTFTTTTKHALRWLTGSNLVSDIDAGFQALAEDLDPKLTPFSAGLLSARPTSTSGTPGKSGRTYYATDTGELFLDLGTSWMPIRLARPVVTSLPSSPYDGQEVSYLADSANGVIWQLKYRAAGASGKRWEYIGGGSLYQQISTAESTSSASYVDLTTFGPAIQLPLSGDYDVIFGADAYSAASATQLFAVLATVASAGAGTAVLFDEIQWRLDQQMTHSAPARITGVPAGQYLTLRYRTQTGGVAANFSKRKLQIRPVRVG